MRLKIGEAEIHYQERGSGQPIVWIHGFPLSSKIFEEQLSVEGARNIVFDLPGFGQSPATARELSIDDYAALTLALLDELSIDSAIFAGVSMGGYICLSIARKAPQRVDGLILIDTRETPDNDEAKANRRKSADAVTSSGVGVVVEQMLPKMFSPATYEKEPESVERLRTIMESSSREGVVSALGAMAARSDSTDVLRAAKFPLLIIVGKDDAITPPADAARMISLAPGAQLAEIAGAGHLSTMEKPQEINRTVAEFVRREVSV
jgi:3-oxoadipate enol-lactonase